METIVRKKDYYQQIASWHNRTPSSNWKENFMKLNIEVKDKLILDCGCGPGHYGKIFSSLGAKVIGYDREDECLRSAALVEPKYVQLIKGKIEEIEKIGIKFDIVFMRYVIHHLQKEIRENILRSIHSILNEHGILIIETSCDDDFSKHYDHQIYPKLTQYLLKVYPSKNELVDMAYNANFLNVEIINFKEIWKSYLNVNVALQKSEDLVKYGVGTTAWLLLNDYERKEFHLARTQELPKIFGDGEVPRYWYGSFFICRR